MNKSTIRSVARWICAASIGVTTAASAESVGVNFLGRNAPTTIQPSEKAGVVEQAFWNNVDNAASGESGTTDPLRNNSGSFTSTTVTFKGNDSWNSDGPSVTPNDRLMLGTIKRQGAGTSGTFSLNQLGSGPYDVILYTSMNADGVQAQFTVGGTSKTIIEEHQFSGSFVEATETTAGNYVRFNGVTPVSGKIDIAMKYISGGDGAGLAGIQAVGTFPANTTPVAISTQPKDSTVAIGSRGGFSVKANSAGWNYQWYRNGSPITGATSSSYTTPVTTAANNGEKYKVVVSNNVNSITSDEVVLHALDPVMAKGVVVAEFFKGINGTAVADLLNSDKYKAGAADDNQLLLGIDTPSNYADNYGVKVSGFITPPVGASGNYYFFIRSDDASAFYLSSDDKVANLGADPIAFENGCCNAFKEPGEGDQTSALVALQAGKRYYFEALMKEGGGGDYLQVAIRGENDTTAASSLKPIHGDWLGTYVLPDSTITVVTAPVAVSTPELVPAKFTASATATSATRGSVPVAYQWLKNGSPIADATGATLQVNDPSLADSGTQYSVRIVAPGATDVTTPAVKLTVTPDVAPPAIQSVAALTSKAKGVEVTVLVDEPMNVSASTALANFKLSTGTVTAARYVENTSGLGVRERAIILNTTGLSAGGSYTLTVSGLKDIKGNVSSSVATPFTVSKMTWADLARPSAFSQDVVATKDGFNVLNGGTAFWNTDDDATFVYEEVTGDFDKVARIEGQDASSNWARAGLHARESLDAHDATASRYQQVHANPYPKKYDGSDSNQGFETNRRLTTGAATTSSNGDSGVNHPAYPNAWVRLIRTGDVLHMYRSSDGTTWFSLGRTDFNPADGSGSPLPAKLFVGLAFGSENGNIPEASQNTWNARFRNYGDFVSSDVAGKQAYSIGVNFTDDSRDGSLGPSDIAGVSAVAQKNWNNTAGKNSEAPLAVKADEGGVAKTTSTTVEWSGVPNTWASTGLGEENNKLTGGNHLLMSGFLDTTGDSTTQITVSGIPSKLTSGKYDLVLYTLGGVASGRGGAFRVTDQSGTELKPYVYVVGSENPTDHVRVPSITSTPGDGATYATGTYVVFSGLSAANIIIEATTQTVNVNGQDIKVGVSGTPRAPVNAIQLVSPSGLLDQVVVTPTISIQGNTITFTGTLQSSDSLNGTFTDVSGVTSPLTIPTGGAQKFWRTRQ